MSLILQIDTSQESANVCISEKGNLIKKIENFKQKDHASFLHSSIDELSSSLSIPLNMLSAVAVTNGPGSYTGLRVGMSSAKGICYALNKPLIAIGSLEAMANDVKNSISEKKSLLCPMIDARRMEVFTALYNTDLDQVLAPSAMILDSNSYASWLSENKIFFFGNGAQKFQKIVESPNSYFTEIKDIALSISQLAYAKFLKSEFENLAICEPLYIKEYQN